VAAVQAKTGNKDVHLKVRYGTTSVPARTWGLRVSMIVSLSQQAPGVHRSDNCRDNWVYKEISNGRLAHYRFSAGCRHLFTTTQTLFTV
jgi:hypothetical protein